MDIGKIDKVWEIEPAEPPVEVPIPTETPVPAEPAPTK